MTKYNILFLNKFYYVKGGSERVFFEEMSILEKHGHQCIPFSRKSPQDAATPFATYFAPTLNLDKKLSLRTLKRAMEIIYSNEARQYLKNMIEGRSINLAHCHNIYGLLTTSVLDELKNNSIPMVLTLHDYKIICPNYQFLDGSRICEDCKKHRYYKAVQNRCVHGSFAYSGIYALENYFNHITSKYRKKVAKFIAVSRFIKDKFVEFGFQAEQITVIPNFINLQNYEATYQKKKELLYLGRLSKEKGVSTLLAAFQAANVHDYKLVIVGDGPLKSELEIEVKQLSIENVEFTGFLSGAILADRVKSAACVIVPSEWYENCPMSILEAFAYGKPVIGANIGGIPELITHKLDGLIFESGDEKDLAEKIDYMVNLSDQAYNRMAMSARNKVEKRFSAEQHYTALMALYNEVLS
jgi:glycosyltransferase involved in cell wall biosynthesis